MALRLKRSRPADDGALFAAAADDGDDVVMADGADDCAAALETAASDAEDERRAKRAMRVRADLRFLEKLPALGSYQRGRFGRRGGVDGGAPHDSGSLWMRALERSMEETSFVTGEAPSRAAMVAPMSMSAAVGVAPRVAVAPRGATPVSGAMRTGGGAVVTRRPVALAGFVAVAPSASSRCVALLAGGKDDESRGAD